MKRSSTVANQRGVPALSEHRRQDGWTSTPCVCDDISEGREYDEMAGERLPKQRPHSIEKKDEAGTQEIERRSTTSSSVKTRRRGVSALIEHRRQDELDAYTLHLWLKWLRRRRRRAGRGAIAETTPAR